MDAAGTVVWQARYTAFGKADILVDTIENNLRFPGQYFDAETGLHYNFHRYYDPLTGRYTQPDPIGFLGEDLNLYGYVWNNAVNAYDPFGLFDSKAFIWGKIGEEISTYSAAGQVTAQQIAHAATIENLQTALDVAGTFDPTPFADAASAVISASQGRWGDACLSGISMLPYAGDLLGKGGKVVKRVIHSADDAVDALRRGEEITVKTVEEARALVIIANKIVIKNNGHFFQHRANRSPDRHLRENPCHSKRRNRCFPITP